MTDQSRGARVRRGARRPGWLLLTVLLVLAIGASSALVFTSQVELLKLAVILALWAAVAAAFVSVIYRRQSDIDQAKVRDLKLVYDLQLDREISARREYELTVETQLRRELTSEIRAQAADEVAGLRAELAALRANLEILFDADLSHRPAIEHDRSRAYGDWPRGTESAGRVTVSRIDAEADEDVEANTDESPIIDVPAEPHLAEAEWPSPAYGGAHRRPSETEQEARRHRREAPREWPSPQPPPKPASQPTPQPQFTWQPTQQERPPAPPPESPPPPQRRVREPAAPAPDWQPAPAEGEFIPAGAPGSNWVPPVNANGSAGEYVGRRRAPEPAGGGSGPPTEVQAPVQPAAEPTAAGPVPPAQPAEAVPPAQPAQAVPPAQPAQAVPPAQPAQAVPPAQPTQAVPPAQPAMQTASTESRRGKHSAPPDAVDPGRPSARPTLAAESGGTPPHAEPPDEPQPSPEAATSRRHRSTEDTGGQSVADLLARLHATPTGGGRRRRRDD